MMLPVFLQQRSHEEKQMTVILGLELTNIMCCSSSESANKTIQTTVSMARIKQSNQQNLWLQPHSRGLCKGSLPCETHYDSAKCIFNVRLKEVLTTKPFNNASVQNFRQTNCELGQIDVERNETADFVVILHIIKRKSPHGNITLMPFIYL